MCTLDKAEVDDVIDELEDALVPDAAQPADDQSRGPSPMAPMLPGMWVRSRAGCWSAMNRGHVPGGHTTWTCDCSATMYGPPLSR